MGGGGIVLAQTTNFEFLVRYSTSSGFDYRGTTIRKLKQETDNYGCRIVEWSIEPQAWAMSEAEQERFRESVTELESERTCALNYQQMTDEQRTLADMWAELKKLKRGYQIIKKRADEAEAVVNGLRRMWDKNQNPEGEQS
jgi:hypothetical protein